MAASSGCAALGTTLTWDSDAVSELDNIDWTGSKGEKIDITNHGSDDSYREYVLGLLDGGTITCSANFVPGDTGQAGIIADQQSRSAKTVVITCPDSGNATFTGTGVVESWRVTAPVDGKLGFEFTIGISGKMTFAA